MSQKETRMNYISPFLYIIEAYAQSVFDLPDKKHMSDRHKQILELIDPMYKIFGKMESLPFDRSWSKYYNSMLLLMQDICSMIIPHRTFNMAPLKIDISTKKLVNGTKENKKYMAEIDEQIAHIDMLISESKKKSDISLTLKTGITLKGDK